MCGIFGSVGASAGRDLLDAMTEVSRHRGPDGVGHVVLPAQGDTPAVCLGNTRLAIVDLDGGAQPMRADSVHLVMNGELYDHVVRRAALDALGHRFGTRSDTEVALRSFLEFGPDAVEHLTGMFALAVWDRSTRRLILARDRVGQKPLFYAYDGTRGDLVFASEPKALVAAASTGARIDTSPDFEALHHFLSLRYVPSPATLLRGVRELPPGHRLIWQGGTIRVEPFWRLDVEAVDERSERELIEALDAALDDAVRRHRVSDVEVGAYLSGGLDSSTIVARMVRQIDAPRTFAVGAPGSDVDELPSARRVADRCGTRHVEDALASTGPAEVLASVPRLVHYLDLPPDPIAPCVERAAALAARHVKVVLGGDGGDELFAGFDRYLGVLALDAPWRPAAALAGRVGAALVAPFGGALDYKSPAQKLRWLATIAGEADLARRYASATTSTRFGAEEKARLYGATLRPYLDLDSTASIVDAVRAAPARDPLHRLLYADMVTRLPGHSLLMGDRLSMAHGLELRSPLLDDRLVELVTGFPANLKMRGRQLKWCLRRLAERDLPSAIARRPKHGFMLPIASWLRGPIHDPVRRLLLDGRTVAEDLFRADEVRRLLDEHRVGRVDHHVRLWLLLGVEAWFRQVTGTDGSARWS
ncbi:MAG: asparagine synthase (glutamine-hydrolyzing) [Acidobacteriota bacterium]